MAVKSVIDIEVNDSEFKRFQALFGQYQSTLQNQPNLWSKVSQTSGAALKGFSGGASALAAQAHSMNNIVILQTTANRAASDQARSWSTMARDSRSFVGNIVDATRSLLRWGTLTGLISGILGGGGLFGISRMAASVGEQRRSALGLGASRGETKSFDINYGRVLEDPRGFLGKINESLTDLDKRKSLWGVGMTDESMKGKSTAEIGVDYLKAAKKIADNTPEEMMKQVMDARFISQNMSVEDFKALKRTPENELNQYASRFQEDARTLELTQQRQKAWQDLGVQLKRAGETIETVFIRGLTPLAGPLEHLSDSFTHLVEAMLKSPLLEKWITDVATAMDGFAKDIGTPEFREKVTDFTNHVISLAGDAGNFVRGVHDLAEGIQTLVDDLKPVLKWLESTQVPDEYDPQKVGSSLGEKARKLWKDNVPGWAGGVDPTTTPEKEPGVGVTPWTGESGHWWDRFIHKSSFRSGFRPESNGGLFNDLEEKKNLPPGILDAVWKTESGRGQNMVSKAGALGHFQFIPATAQRYGVQDPFDLGQSAKGAASYFSDLLARFHGDIEKAAAGYNWGEGNVEKDVARYGARWKEHLPEETAGYVRKVTEGIGQACKGASIVTIRVENNTGGNASVSASELAT